MAARHTYRWVFVLLGILILGGKVPAQFKGTQLGPEINTSTEELSPRISPDGTTLYFVRTKYKRNEGGKKGGQDIWISKKENGVWTKAENPGSPLNNPEHNAVAGIAEAGNSLILNNLYPFEDHYAPGISLSSLGMGGKWSTPRNLFAAGEMPGDGFLSVWCAPEMDLMLLAMIPEGEPHEDLYVIFKQADGSWSPPRSLGKDINTEGFETAPYLSKDRKKLFFATDARNPGQASDIYFSFRLDDSWERWTEPVNLGPEVNQAGFEAYFILDEQEEQAFFVHGSAEGDPGDIYTIPVADIPVLAPMATDTIYTITRQGQPLILNLSQHDPEINWDKTYGYSITGNGELKINRRRDEPFVYSPEPSFVGNDTLFTLICENGVCIPRAVVVQVTRIEGAPVRVMDTVRAITRMNTPVEFEIPDVEFNGSEKEKSLTGLGSLEVPVSGNQLRFMPAKDRLGDEIRSLSTRQGNALRIYPIRITILPADQEATPVEHGLVLLSGKVFDQENLKGLGAKLQVLDAENGEVLEELESRSTGQYQLKLEPGRKYRIVARHPDYFSKVAEIDLSQEKGGNSVQADFPLLKSPEEFRIGSIFPLSRIFFDFDKSSLKEASFPALDSLYSLLNLYPTLRIELRGHTDFKGSEDYNLRLSQKRTESVVRYLTDKGIDPKRLVPRGYGESRPIADNYTEKGRALNRRVEWRILEK